MEVSSASTANAGIREFRDCVDCPAMVALPGGDFLMGSPETEEGRTADEGPQRHVVIAPFAIGKLLVTRAEWKAFVTETARPTRGGCSWSALPILPGMHLDGSNPAASWENLGFEQADDHPVVCMRWNDAQDYVVWLSQRTGHRYRLPSESEWEYAARAGSSAAYFWGPKARRDRANYGADTGFSGFSEGADRWFYTSPVTAFPPNRFGLHDMAGNAMQWVQDCLSDEHAVRPTDGSAYEVVAPLQSTGDFAAISGQSSCAYRVSKGGAWGEPPDMIRSAARNFAPPPGASLETYSNSGGGIRVARSLK
ncbi:MAG: formylglycine-generating enzyme family protein [Pseudomonadota bacterium]|nr:formylglycine-generating enzyme family protein [Pseudomonadota bacterium]